MIKVEKMSYQVPKGHQVFKDVNFEAEPGHFYGVLGKNGAGKTTLIDLLMGIRRSSAGKVLVLNEDPMQSERNNKSKIFTLSHDISIQQSHRIKDYFDFTSYFYPHYSKKDERRFLELFNLDADSKFGSLSSGQKAKAQMVAALSSNTPLLLIDEITAVLDPESRFYFFEILKEIRQYRNKTVLLATNIIEDLETSVDKILFIQDQKIETHQPRSIFEMFKKSA